eukprot:CAMPEP_0183729682 /NCGR_PEP_ID=MMETSP0737-20130205/30924_1 /TAXON_ID=385413 /ORGANISM="Thalassiosira miniscula, Strain CCMP1093" /LENGTH=721 /DNA_ID=CAMNT_0025961939 /DNA_START=243 /DNA_END=2408 /DNA_ORIENTATION=+
MGNKFSSSRRDFSFGDEVTGKHINATSEQPQFEVEVGGKTGSLTSNEYINTLFCSAILSDALYDNDNDNIRSDNGCKNTLECLANTYPFFQPKEAHFSPDRDFVFCELETMLIVAFRGTIGTDDWLDTNLNLRSKTSERLHGGDVEVHEGFFDCAIKVPLDAAWALASSSRKRLVFTGHSKGGAVAEICARMACLENRANQIPGGKYVSCITFGQPHVLKGNSDFSSTSSIGLILHRYVLDGDIVPFILSPLQFLPSGNLFQINEDINSVTRSSKLTQDDVMTRGGGLDYFQSRFTPNLTSNHAMQRYKRLLLADANANSRERDGVICKVGKELVPCPWGDCPGFSQKLTPSIKAVWKGTEENIISVSIKFENVDDNEAWKYKFTTGILTLKTRHSDGEYSVDDSARQDILSAKPGSIKLHTRTTPDGMFSCDISTLLEFKIPDGFVPDNGSYEVELHHSMHRAPHTDSGSLSLRTVWFIGDTGSGKTHLISCLETLAEHGNQSDVYLNWKEQANGATPAADEASFRSCGIFFRELLGARFHDRKDDNYFRRQLYDSPPMMVVCVANALMKHACDEEKKRGLKCIAEELRALFKAASPEGNVGICWAFTQWSRVLEEIKDKHYKDMKETLGVAENEKVFKVNSGVFSLGITTFPIHGVEELLSHIRVLIRQQQGVKLDWRFLRRLNLIANELLINHKGKVGAAAVTAAWWAVFKVPLPAPV